MTTPAEDPTTGTTPAFPTGEASSPELPSSRDILAGLDKQPQVDWRAKYDGVVGASRQRLAEINKQLEARDLRIRELEDLAKVGQTEAATLKTKAEAAIALQQQVDTLTAEKTAVESASARQQLLFKYPQLLSMTGEDGTNPLVALVMGSSMPLEELEKSASALAATMGKSLVPPVNPAAGATPPGARPAGGSEDLATVRKKALAADRKFIESGMSDREILAESQRLWDQVKVLQAQKTK